ncbi:MAG: Epoxide hydrolase [Acidimicrobiales bacterium]|nr:Epoxide hydrolase [Acidimicrobiales bacterium]
MAGDQGAVTEAVARLVAHWEASGERIALGDHEVWCRLVPAATPSDRAPLLVLHGFPTCSFDWRLVLPDLAAERDVILVDCLGFGLSDKPDVRYGLRLYADGAEAAVAHFGIGHVDLLTHDVGDSVGGELLARSLEGRLGFTIGHRVVTNGSIYMDLVQLTVGQQLLLGLPDAVEEAVGADGGTGFRSGVVGTFAPGAEVDDVELDGLVALAAREGGLALLPRTIRYIEDRRAEEERFTGAIERHPSPVDVVWGRLDPVAVHDMAERLVARRDGARLVTLEGVGHYPMLEAPERFSTAVLGFLSGP